jgi:anaerobic selenocysteine-containing dehydrogenase/Fe-S-cluster-containing dehydrogenase component
MPDGLSRRSFLKLAATASAAAAIPGCEPAARKLIPYVVPDENVIPGVPTFYATTCAECSAGCGIVARVREGRVIKLEGNPGDPISQGAICARGQAALQGLYNPDRLANPQKRGTNGELGEVSWDNATKLFNERLAQAAKNGKDRVAFIGASQGPTLDKISRQWLQSWNSSRIIFWERINDEPARAATEVCFGRRDLPVYRLDQAETIISFDADFVETWGSPVEYARQYAEFRSPRMRKNGLTIGRSAYVGARLNATAAKCDEWVAANPGTEGVLAMGVLNMVVTQGWVAPNAGVDAAALRNFVAPYDTDTVSKQTGVSAETIKKLGSWFGQADGSVAIAGTEDQLAHIAAYILNAVTGNVGKTMVFLDGSPPEALSRADDVMALIEAMRNGQIDVLVVAAGNPVYSMPPSWGFHDVAGRVGFVAWLGEVPDESAEMAHLMMPVHHALESWRDTAPRAGVYGLGQPVMQPVFRSRALQDIMISSAHLAAGATAQSMPWENAADAVNAAWQDLQTKVAPSVPAADFWNQARREGGFFQAAKEVGVSLNSAVFQQALKPAAEPTSELTLVAFPHLFLYDGRGANKPWLQEMPEPVSQIVWDSWAEMHPGTAAKFGLKQDYESVRLYAGINVIEITTAAGPLELAVTITPTVKPGVIAAPIGQGHTSYGRFAKGRGVNLWAFLPERMRNIPVTVRLTEKRNKLITPMGKSDMMGRSIIEAMSVDDLVKGVAPEVEGEPHLDVPYEMYDAHPYPGHKWGMTIDVNSCTGCSACVAACYAENNIPVVGKDQVDGGRIMSWLRIERFIPNAEEAAKAPPLYIAPILCQQCDHAPCEPVCPVFASHHTPEGLNAQIYNRCIGTRFCENNCPYKVRRFNWYEPEWPEPMNLQLNPEVTVRGAGVMEKCTFCIQRITVAEIDARVEERSLVDGEIIPACAQACPSRAISFGDINDPNSVMMKRRVDNKIRNYTMLPEFNALPAITYLRALYRQRGNA